MTFWGPLGWVVLSCAALMLAGGVAYLSGMRRNAQYALLFAFPRRRALARSRLGQQALKYVTPKSVDEEHAKGRIDLTTFDPTTMQPSPVVRGDLWARGGKRALDILVSLSLLVFTLPLLLVTAIAIRLESPGPVFYRQTRVGRAGRLFQVIKFRSMRNDAEKDGAQWATSNDPRITRVGAFIRRTRIDEIPQVLNILKGEMSFVGPRPERPEFTSELARKIPFYDDRHRVKPGLTGWAQINYPYGASEDDAREKLTYDLYYMKHYSLMLDLFIIIRTIKVALLGTGSR